jgi:hypothetical protein
MDDFVVVGGRQYKLTPGQVEIASSGNWSLVKSSRSVCGKWQNYKLYRNVALAPKKVFYLAFDRVTSEMFNGHDAMILQEHYEGMADWVFNAILGKVFPAPKFPALNGRRRVRTPAEELLCNEKLVSGVMAAIDERWISGDPLSPYPQTSATGRYAPKVIAKTLRAALKDIDAVIWGLLVRGDIQIVVFNQRMKSKGLRVVNVDNVETKGISA